MPNVNLVILAGHLTRDPVLRYTSGNTPIANFGIAVNSKWKDAQGETKERVLFVDCTAFGKTAETINQHLTKGRAVLIEGELQLEQWSAEDGTKRTKHSIRVSRFQFLGDGGGGERRQPAKAAPRSQATEDSGGEEIPF